MTPLSGLRARLAIDFSEGIDTKRHRSRLHRKRDSFRFNPYQTADPEKRLRRLSSALRVIDNTVFSG
jgi:hypothetical protein